MQRFELSLNGKEPLVGSDVTLKEMGIVNGDIVHVILKDLPDKSGATGQGNSTAVATDPHLLSQMIKMGFPKVQ